MKRDIDILVLSDLHLGTNACRANKLYKYLKSVSPKMLILNGDIIDFWLLNLKKWPKKHTKILGYFFNLMVNEVPVYYLTGNHDDYLRRFSDFSFHNFYLKDELILDLEGRKTWFMHGDKFDTSVTGSKRKLAIRAGRAFDGFIKWNRMLNEWEQFFGRKVTNISKIIKDRTKKSVTDKHNFEQLYIDHAAENDIDVLVCGHVHRPGISKVCATNGHKEILYLNSGDWTESCTALEYRNGKWDLYCYKKKDDIPYSILREVSFDEEEDLP